MGKFCRDGVLLHPLIKKMFVTFILTILLLTNISFADDVDSDAEPTYSEILEDIEEGRWVVRVINTCKS